MRDIFRDFYNDPAWRRLRNETKKYWLNNHFNCPYCKLPLKRNQRLVVDHIISRRKAPDLSMNPNNLCVLHHVCHNKKTSYVDNNTKIPVNDQGYPPDWE